jgi:hypothetical protein
MSIFEVKISGNLYRNWPNEVNFNLLDCHFAKGNGIREFYINTEVETNDTEDAKYLGLHKCLTPFRLFKFCIDEQVELDCNHIIVKEKGSPVSNSTVSFDSCIVLVKSEPLTAEQLEAIHKVQTKFETEKDEEKKELLKRAIHWFELGKLETQSKIDRFIKFWIALEVLVGGKGSGLVSKIKTKLTPLYPNINNQKNSETVGRMYGVRKEIIHYGWRKPEELDKSLELLENIMVDLLREQFGLNSKYLAKKFFI